MRATLILAMAIGCATTISAAESVKLEKLDGTLAISIDGRPFTMLIYEGHNFKKPFLIDLHAPGNVIVTRPLDESITEHPHHKGMWVAVDEVNELKHWAENHTIRTKSVEILEKEGNPARFRITNEWLDGEGNPLLLETSTVSIYPDRLIAYDISLTPAGEEPVEFADTKEGFFAVRLRDELREKGGNGKIVNAQGHNGAAEAWGQESKWVDYSGEIEGEPVGVAIFDHPGNPRPGRYHVRNYGLFTISPFGQSAYTNGELKPDPVYLKPGETLRLRYAAWFHGEADPAEVGNRYRRYIEAARQASASEKQ